MNNFRWTVPFMQKGRRRRFMGWNNRSNTNWGGWSMVLALISAGGAAWYGMTQGRNHTHSMKEHTSDIPSRTQTAFSEEFMPKAPIDESE